MSSIVVSGDTSGAITISAPAVAGTNTLSLPASTGTILTTTGGVTPGTAGNVLTSNGTTWTSAAAAAFDAGTRIIFAQTSAPTGWTKDTTNYNNHALRVVTGAASTGGTVDFTTAFASGLSDNAVTLSTAQIPSHSHSSTSLGYYFGGTVGCAGNGVTTRGCVANQSTTTSATGGGGSHTHTLPSFAVKYLDVITATKN